MDQNKKENDLKIENNKGKQKKTKKSTSKSILNQSNNKYINNQKNNKIKDSISEKRLISYFFVIGYGKELEPFENQSIETGNKENFLNTIYKGEILELFPNSSEEDPFPPHIWMFCLPKGFLLQSKDPGPNCFPFVLTQADGKRSYGYCLTFYEPISNELLKNLSSSTTMIYAPKCICVLSRFPFYSIFREWLYELYRKIFFSKLTIPIEQYIINFVMEVPVPPPRNFKIKFKVGDKWLILSRPPKESFHFIDIPLHFLFKTLGIQNVLTLFKCVLLEKKILLYSKQYTLLTYSCEIIQLLIYPFQWSHVYVPILPELLKDFIFSPTPFIMGVHIDSISNSILESIKQDVVLVDLDNNQLFLPENLVDLPELEKNQLFGELKQHFHEDIMSLDSPHFNPYSLSDNKGHINDLTFSNIYIQSCFLKFFVSLFKDYRQYLLYIRVFEKPIAIFDTANFLQSRLESKDFFENLMETQSFSYFLEAFNQPKPNIFDEWIDKEIYKLNIEDIVSLYNYNNLSKERFPEICTIPEPKSIPGFNNEYQYNVFPKLNQSILETGLHIHPVKIHKTPQSFNKMEESKNIIKLKSKIKEEKEDTINLITSKIKIKEGDFKNLKIDKFEEEKKKIREFSKKFLSQWKNNKVIEAHELTQFLDLLKFDFGRIEFSKELISDYNTNKKICLKNECFLQLTEVINFLLREANSANDFISPYFIITAAFMYYKIENGAEDFIYLRLRKQEIWQNFHFWEKIFFESISKMCIDLYGDIRQQMEQWKTKKDIEKQNIIQKEIDSIFHLLSEFAFNMVNLGVDAEIIRRFMFKMCSVTSLDSDQTKILMQLLANMAKADDLLDTTFLQTDNAKTPEIKSRFKKGDLYVPVGLQKIRDQSEIEGKKLFQEFLEEKDTNKKTLRKVRKTIRATLFSKNEKKKKNVETEINSEYREDYTVKTFKGHTEGVLYVIINDKNLVSSSCDGTIKIWNLLTTHCISTLSGHSGWVNIIQFFDKGKLVSGSYDRTLKIWDLNKGSKIHSFRGHKGSISCLKIKERHIVSGSHDHLVHLWDYRHHKKPTMSFFGHTAPITCLELFENYVLSGSKDTNLRLWDIRSGKSLKTFSGHTDWVKCCKFENDLIVSGSYDSRIKIWNYQKEECQTLEGHNGTVNDLYSDSKTLFSISQDSTIKMWDLNYGQCITTLEGHSDEIVSISPFKTNHIATCSYDSSVKIWDIDKKCIVWSLLGHTYRISSMNIFENKIVTSSWDKTVKLWEFPQ